jgi:hypothetical protein
MHPYLLCTGNARALMEAGSKAPKQVGEVVGQPVRKAGEEGYPGLVVRLTLLAGQSVALLTDSDGLM